MQFSWACVFWPLILLSCLTVEATAAGPPLRPLLDLHGDPLPLGARMRLGTSRFCSEPSDSWDEPSLIVSRDGRLLADRDPFGVVRVCLLESGKVLRRFRDGKEIHHVGAFSSDARLLATTTAERVCLWEVATGRLLGRISPIGPAPVSRAADVIGFPRVAFLPEDRVLAVWDGRGDLSLWDVQTRKEKSRRRFDIESFAGSPSPERLVRKEKSRQRFGIEDPRLAAFSQAGHFMLEQSRLIRVFHIPTGRLFRVAGPRKDELSWSSLSPDGRFLASSLPVQPGIEKDVPGAVLVRDVRTGREVLRCSHEDRKWLSAQTAFSPSGRLLAVAGSKKIKVWDVEKRWLVHDFAAPTGFYSCLFVSEDALLIHSASNAWRIRDLRLGKERPVPDGHRGRVFAAEFTADGRTLVSVGEDGTLRVWDLTLGKQRRCVQLEPEGYICTLSVSPDGSFAVVSGWPGQPVTAIDLKTGRTRWRLPTRSMAGIPPPLPASWISPDSQVAIVPYDLMFERWTAVAAVTGKSTPFPESFHQGVESPDGAFLASADWKAIRLSDARTKKYQQTLDHPDRKSKEGYRSIGFSPNGHSLAALTDSEIQLWEIATGKLFLRQPLPEEFRPLRMLFAPPDRLLVAGYRPSPGPQSAVVWEAISQRILCTMPCPPSGSIWAYFPAVRLALSPDGKQVAVCGNRSGDMLLWDIPPPDRDKDVPLSEAAAKSCWDDLASADATRAWRSMQTLASSPAAAVALLRERLRPAKTQGVQKLIADLDSDTFATREAASRALARTLRWGSPLTEEALEVTLARKPSLEVRRRIAQLLGARGRPRPLSDDGRRHLRAVMVLEHITDKDSLALLKKLASGGPTRLALEAQKALDRLARHAKR